jgi:hypothetical protein
MGEYLAIAGVVHIEDFGDQPLQGAVWAGSRGEGRRLEGFALNFVSPVPGVRMLYMCHLEGIGDSPWIRAGDFCGTRGQRRSVQGLAIKLVGPAASRYHVMYGCHVQDMGDLGPVRDGEFCGTRGRGLRVEAIDVWVVPDGREGWGREPPWERGRHRSDDDDRR